MTKKRPSRPPIDGKTVALGFALGNAFMPGTAHGYYALKWGLLTTTVGGTLWATSTSTYGSMSTSYLTSDMTPSPSKKKAPTKKYTPPSKPSPPPTGPGGDDPTDEEPFVIAQSLVHSALLQSQGDLGMHMKLLSESPTAFAQLSHELSSGEGPAVDALVAATGLDVAALQNAWAVSRTMTPIVDSRESAGRFIRVFLRDIAPQIEVRLATQSELAWRMIRELQRHEAHEGSLVTHTWLAQWMGVSTDGLLEATAQAVKALDGTSDLRASVYSSPQQFFKTMAYSLSKAEKAALGARAAEIHALRAKLRDSEQSDA